MDPNTRAGIARRPQKRVTLTDAGELSHESRIDAVVVEEPLEIRIAGEPYAVTMRTPGHDADLALGLLFAEGVVAGPGDVGTIAPCGRPDEEGYGNAIDVVPGPGKELLSDVVLAQRRGTLMTSACGVCGRKSIDDLKARCRAVPAGAVVPSRAVATAPRTLRAHQENFARTGGIHAAAVLDGDGTVLGLAEDVGRHNAVDKVVGALVRGEKLPVVHDDAHARQPRRGVPTILAVSGRVSFEIVQKAAMAAIPVVVAVSAPTSLAIDLADAMGITLAAFVRDGRFNLYTHHGRIVEA